MLELGGSVGRGWYLCLGIKGERNERDNEAGTSQHNMRTGDERSGFQSETAGGFLTEEGREKGETKGGEVGECLCIPEFLYPPPLPPPQPTAPRPI